MTEHTASIICSCDGKELIAADGYVDNCNVSGFVTGIVGQNIEGYIRIDNSYSYNAWRFDYRAKTESPHQPSFS